MGLVSKIMGSAFMKPAIEVIDKLVEDKDERNRLKAQMEQGILDNSLELKKIALEEVKIKTDMKMEVIHNIPNFAIWYVLLFVIVFNFILPSTISYIARLFFYDAIINQGKDMTQIMLFLKPPTIELPSEYWGMMGSIYGINKIKRGFNRHNDRKLQENLKK